MNDDLEEYVEWIEHKKLEPIDTSPGAYRQERADVLNRRRVEQVLELVDGDYPPPNWQDLPLPNDHMFALDTLGAIRDILTGKTTED